MAQLSSFFMRETPVCYIPQVNWCTDNRYHLLNQTYRLWLYKAYFYTDSGTLCKTVWEINSWFGNDFTQSFSSFTRRPTIFWIKAVVCKPTQLDISMGISNGHICLLTGPPQKTHTVTFSVIYRLPVFTSENRLKSTQNVQSNSNILFELKH